MKLIAIILVSLLDLFPGVQIVQDSTMAVLLDEAVNGKRELVEVDGYRVQIYSSNQQQSAKGECRRSGKCGSEISVPTMKRKNTRNYSCSNSRTSWGIPILCAIKYW